MSIQTAYFVALSAVSESLHPHLHMGLSPSSLQPLSGLLAGDSQAIQMCSSNSQKLHPTLMIKYLRHPNLR